MKKIMLFLAVAMQLSGCGREPKEVSPANDPFKYNQTTQSLEAFGEYQSTPSLFSFFLYPDSEDIELIKQKTGLKQLSEIASVVGQESTLLDRAYEDIAVPRKEQNDLQAERIVLQKKYMEESRPERENQEKSIYASYKCFLKVNAEGTPKKECVFPYPNDDAANFVYPSKCTELRTEPWLKKNPEVIACDKKIRAITERAKVDFENKYPEIHARIAELQEKMNDLNGEVRVHVEKIIEAIDPYTTPETYKNWIQAEASQTNFIHVNGHKVPEINMGIRFNNITVGRNDVLSYSNARETEGGKENEIVDTKVFIDENSPTLSLKLFEKKIVEVTDPNTGYPQITEEKTGRFFKLILRRSIQSFGLLYIGDARLYEANGKYSGKEGKMKIIFEEIPNIKPATP